MLPMASPASCTAWLGVGPTCQISGANSLTMSSLSATAQPGPHTMPWEASSPANTALDWAGPPITMNGSFSAMAMASLLAAVWSVPAPVPT